MRRIFAICVMVHLMVLLVRFPLGISSAASDPVLALASADFQNGATIPARYTCSGANTSPTLKWTGIPSGAQSIVLIVDDPDAPGGTFVHWVTYNIPPARNGLPEGFSATAKNANGEEGTNGRGELGYTGPCPPPGKPHHYHFRLYALDHKLQLGPGATEGQVQAAMKGHVLATGELVGIFER